MRPAKRSGRVVGMLLLVQLVGLILPFILLLPITTDGFLESAAGLEGQIRVAVLLLFANGALTMAISIAAFPIMREHGSRMALWLPAVSVLWFAMQTSMYDRRGCGRTTRSCWSSRRGSSCSTACCSASRWFRALWPPSV